jgi:unsaturated rhamnogalacturonyl hydrolase
MKRRRVMTGLAGIVLAVALSAHAHAATTRLTIVQDMTKADAYWLANGVSLAGATWQNSTFHVGNLDYLGVSGATPNTATQTWAASNDYKVDSGADSDGPNDLGAGEVYLMLGHPDSIRARVASEVAAQNDTLWTYIDALNIAMPSYARLGVLDKSAADLNAMQAQFNYTETTLGLFNKATGLWWRDATFKGTNTYWSRGNGWAMMALAKVLQILPPTDPRYAGYLQVFDQMAAALVPLQLSDGFWGADLRNPSAYGYEESGTAFFTYAMAWGINAGILSPSVYGPVVSKAWTALSTIALQTSGEVGYVQGATVGSDQPSDGQPVKVTDTSAYGVGGFLMAGSEMVQVIDPPPNTELSAPTISGTARQGQILSEAHGGWLRSPTSYSYQWEDCDGSGASCSEIAGATNQTYLLTGADVGHTIRVVETALSGGVSGDSANSSQTAVVTPLPPSDITVPAISGDTTQAQTLTESHGTWSNSPNSYRYQWEDCDPSGGICTAIPGATRQSDTLAASDVGHAIRVVETVSNAGGAGSPATSAATGAVAAVSATASKPANSSPPVISGTTTVGHRLSSSTGAWSGTPSLSYSYRWALCTSPCRAIAGATGSSYTLTSADRSAKIAVVVTATNSTGHAQASSPEVGPVRAAGPRPGQVKAALSKVLTPSGRTAKINVIVKDRGYKMSFTAPGGGRVIIDWYARIRGRRTLIALASVVFHRPGKATVKLKLTRQGLKLLDVSRKVKITTKASFTPTGGGSTSSTKAATLTH